MTPEELGELLEAERSGRRRDVLELTVADRLDEDDDRLRGGLL